MLPDDPAYASTDGLRYGHSSNPVPARFASTIADAPTSDLETRVAELEAQLKKYGEKEAAAKKKAAEKPTVSAGGRIMWDNAVFSQALPAATSTATSGTDRSFGGLAYS